MLNEALRGNLESLIQAELNPATGVAAVEPADGHAGLTYRVVLDGLHEPGDRHTCFLRLAPAGVRRSGNTDVYRQAPLLSALGELGLPVPAVLVARADEASLGVPFILTDGLPGSTFFVWEPDPQLAIDAPRAGALWRAAATTLPRFHAVPWQEKLSDWEKPRSLRRDVEHWRPIYSHAELPEHRRLAAQVESGLLRALPEDAPVGLFHGDYQPGNILFEGDRISGVIDWELSGIGAQLTDLGWLMMFVDRACWHEDYCPRYPIEVAEVVQIYEDERQAVARDAHWYHAYAAFKLGAIACLNVKLHRKGQRPDPVWEKLGLSIPLLFARAAALLKETV